MQLHLVDALVKGLLIGLFMAISVGPTLFAVIKYSLNHSYKAGLAFVLGVSLSDIMYVTIANLAATWLAVLRSYERPIAYAGGAILVLVGLSGLVRKYKPQRASAKAIVVTGGHYFKIFSTGFIINTINPGVIINWLAIVTAAANTTNLYRLVLFGSCLILILSIDFLKVFLADGIRRRLTQRRIMYLNKFSAACILTIGLALILSTAFNVQFKKHKGESMNERVETHAPSTLNSIN